MKVVVIPHNLDDFPERFALINVESCDSLSVPGPVLSSCPDGRLVGFHGEIFCAAWSEFGC